MAKKNAKKSKPAAKAAPKPAKIAPAKKPRSKGEVFRTLAEQAGISRKQVAAVFDAMGAMLAADLGRGCGVFNCAGLMKVIAVRKPAVPAREGINPFTKEPTMFKAKPARTVVKVRALKALKSMV